MSPDPEWSELLREYPGTPGQLFGYAQGQPTTRIDPLGLLSFQLGRSCRRLPPDQLERLRGAIADAQGNLGRVTACKPLVSSSAMIVIRCGSDCGGDCGRYKPPILSRRSICISPYAFGGTRPDGTGCGRGDTCLGSTLFHEAVHACGGEHPTQQGRVNPYACEQRFYPLCIQNFRLSSSRCSSIRGSEEGVGLISKG